MLRWVKITFFHNSKVRGNPNSRGNGQKLRLQKGSSIVVVLSLVFTSDASRSASTRALMLP